MHSFFMNFVSAFNFVWQRRWRADDAKVNPKQLIKNLKLFEIQIFEYTIVLHGFIGEVNHFLSIRLNSL